MTRVLALALLLFATAANALDVEVYGENVKFTYDPETLYGVGTVFVTGNTIFFTPNTFKAESLDGAGIVTATASLDIRIEVLEPLDWAMSAFHLIEEGDYKINKIIGGGASASAVGTLTVDSQTSAFSTFNDFDAGTLPATEGALAPWSAGTSIFLADTPDWDQDTDVIMTLDNTLSAYSEVSGEVAFIEKKFQGTAIGITAALAPAVIPVPATVWLFGSALMGFVVVARRKRKAV